MTDDTDDLKEGVHSIKTTSSNGFLRAIPKQDQFNSKVPNEEFVPNIKWPDLIAQLFIHGGCIYGVVLMFSSAKLLTSLFVFVTIYTSGFGITAGVHRLWSHKAYKAKWPLRLILVFLFTITGQKHIYAWALDHRVHHKYSETTSDPHNAKRGFFFSHVGWLVLTPHPDVVKKRKIIDMSDLEADPIVMWQKRYYPILFLLLTVGLPVAIPVYFWEETIWNSFWICFNTRFCITLNIAFCVNSLAHMWGYKPYDKDINPVENMIVSIAALGEGWHNYHHVFPWDYKTGEFGSRLNLSTQFIDFFAKLGWAYDLKYASPEMISRRARKSGDGTHIETHLWGYGDEDIEIEDKKELENIVSGTST
uniref:Fatty acid desaturase domain-containing protein n=1 Tax=Photinus pyralis TaxID=7054 RepID=A0A1Y1MPN0_PHOPY